LLGKAATGFMETNTPNCYGGKLVVKLPEGLHFKQTEAPAFLLIGNAEEIAFNVDVNDSMAILSLKTSSVQTGIIPFPRYILRPCMHMNDL